MYKRQDFSYLPADFVDTTLTKGENIVRFNKKLIDATKAVAGCYKVQILSLIHICGVADDKGPMVATLYALKFLKEEGVSPVSYTHLLRPLRRDHGAGHPAGAANGLLIVPCAHAAAHHRRCV